MGQPEEIEFKVDEQYKNDKGVFKVISIHKDQMVIRWESGEEIRTDIELQRRIAERRRFNKLQRLAETQARKSKAKGTSSAFTGFALTDFKQDAIRTTWRSRGQLGSAVTPKIDTNRFKFNSWAFDRKPEMHVQDIRHRGQAVSVDQAKFVVRVDPQHLYYGFQVARPDTTNGEASTDWDAFNEWSRRQENEQMFRKLAMENNMGICNLANPSSSILLAGEDGWRAVEGSKEPSQTTLMAFIDESPKTAPFNLEIAAIVAKSDAIASGPDIAVDIAQLFTRLLPLYQASVIR